MSEKKIVRQGSHVTLHIRMVLESGFVVEDTFEEEPLAITIGNGVLDSALESVLVGLTESEKKEFHFAAGEVFGHADEQNIHQLSRDQFSGFEERQLQKGVILGFDTPSGEQVPGMIINANDEMLTVDFNHPLSGKPFTCWVEILAVE